MEASTSTASTSRHESLFCPYLPLGMYGDHKRAVSSVKFAPSRLCKSSSLYSSSANTGSSINSNNYTVSALVASASADGTCKVWNVRVEETAAAAATGRLTYYDSMNGTTASASASKPNTMSADEWTLQRSQLKQSNQLDESERTDDDGLQQQVMKKKRKQSKNNATNNPNGPAKVLNLHPLATCVGHSRGINEVAWNPTTPLLCTASDDKTVRIWDAVTSEALVELKGHDNFVFSVDSYGSTVATGSFDETVKLWDIRTGDCVCTLPAHSDPVTSVSFNTVDGTTLASSSHDGLCRVWDVATGECLKTLYASGNPPMASVKYAPNGRFVLTNTLDSTVRLWPVVGDSTLTAGGGSAGMAKTASSSSSSSSNSIKVYRDAANLVNTKYSIPADFTHTGNIVVGSETGCVVVLDVQTGRTLQTLPHYSMVQTDNRAVNTNVPAVDGTEKTDNRSSSLVVPPASVTSPVVLAVSAHDRWPLIATGTMSTDGYRKVEFWSAL